MILINSRNKKIKDKFFNDSDKFDAGYIRQILTFDVSKTFSIVNVTPEV